MKAFTGEEMGGKSLLFYTEKFKDAHKNTIGFIQVRFDNGNEKLKLLKNIEDYYEKHITANSYAIDEFYYILIDKGFSMLFLTDISTRANCATYYIKRKMYFYF